MLGKELEVRDERLLVDGESHPERTEGGMRLDLPPSLRSGGLTPLANYCLHGARGSGLGWSTTSRWSRSATRTVSASTYRTTLAYLS